MYPQSIRVSAETISKHANTHRPWSQHHVRLSSLQLGGGHWQVRSSLSDMNFGTVRRTASGWHAMSPSLTFQSDHPLLTDAVLALAAYGRLRSSSSRQLNYAKATRALVTQMVAEQLEGLELLTFWRFLEMEPYCFMSTWWLRHRKVMCAHGWAGFKAALCQDKLSKRFMALYRSVQNNHLHLIPCSPVAAPASPSYLINAA